MVFQKCLASLTRSSKVSDPKIINIGDPRTTLLTSTMIKDPQTGNLFQKGKKTKMSRLPDETGLSNLPAENKKQRFVPIDSGAIDYSQLQLARAHQQMITNAGLSVCSTNLDQKNTALGGPDIRVSSRTSFKSKAFRKNDSKANFKVPVTGITTVTSMRSIYQMRQSVDTVPSPVRKAVKIIGKPIGKGQILSEKTSFDSLRFSVGSFMVPK